jgi:hypothetical protein
MNKRNTNKVAVNDVNAPAEKTSIKITMYQSGSYLKAVAKDKKEIFEAKKEDNYLTLFFEINNAETLNTNIGMLIDVLISDELLNKAINKKRFVSQLDLNFEIEFKNQTFDGTKFFKVRPNFFNSRPQLKQFAQGFTLFLASISGLYRPFSYSTIDYVKLIDGDKPQLKKDYEKSEAKKFLYTNQIQLN